jgi:hypothetical protein
VAAVNTDDIQEIADQYQRQLEQLQAEVLLVKARYDDLRLKATALNAQRQAIQDYITWKKAQP